MSRMSAPIRVFWCLYMAAALALLIGVVAGPAIERTFLPIRSNQTIHDVRRDAGRLCWVWSSDKLRLAESDNVDVFLDTTDGDRTFPELLDLTTGEPWHRLGAVGLGHHDQPVCVLLPPSVSTGNSVALRVIVHYRGILDLWDVPVALPDVESPGE